MSNRPSPWKPSLVLTGALVVSAACGGGGNSSSSPTGASNPPAVSTPAPTATATPRPAPTPTPDPRAGLPEGPVDRFSIKVRTVNNGERDAEQDGQGRFIVFVGERVDLDSTQKNAGGQICRWTSDPVWLVNGQDIPSETSNGAVYRRGSSQPFLLKTTMERTGTFQVTARIDGVDSNALDFKINP